MEGSFLLWGVCKRETSTSIDKYNNVESPVLSLSTIEKGTMKFIL